MLSYPAIFSPRNCPAYKALFEAGRVGKVKFFGSRKQFGTPSEELSVAEFVPERMWNHRHESIDPDLFGVDSMDEYKAAHDKGLNQIWWNVCVEKASFVDWLKGVLEVAGDGPASIAIRTQLEIKEQEHAGTEKVEQLF